MELLFAAICLMVGIVVGFVFGKRVSGWCVQCGRSRSQVRRQASTQAR